MNRVRSKATSSHVRFLEVILFDFSSNPFLCLTFIYVKVLEFYFLMFESADYSLGSSVACWPANAREPQFEALYFNILLGPLRNVGTSMVGHQ